MHKILIIEDDRDLRSQMMQLLRYEGFEALEASDGKAGVKKALETNPDLIICDIMMPGLDGFGVLKNLRGNPRTALTPFIFLTALVENQSLRHGMEEGADDYITKPYNPDNVIASVHRRLKKRDIQVEESLQQRDELSLSVASLVPREILEPLNQITTAVNLIAMNYASGDPHFLELQDTVQRETVRLRRIIKRLHLYAQLPQLYAKRFELQGTEKLADAGTVIKQAAMGAAKFWNREKDVTVDVPEVTVMISGNYVALLVEELVDNACKFSEPGTPIRVQSETQPECLSLSVFNEGVGLTQEQIGEVRAFKQFWSGQKRPAGLGLGLVLVQGIARLHGCEFGMQSEAGWTRASILMPLESTEAAI